MCGRLFLFFKNKNLLLLFFIIYFYGVKNLIFSPENSKICQIYILGKISKFVQKYTGMWWTLLTRVFLFKKIIR
jgi:hypothetical protein